MWESFWNNARVLRADKTDFSLLNRHQVSSRKRAIFKDTHSLNKGKTLNSRTWSSKQCLPVNKKEYNIRKNSQHDGWIVGMHLPGTAQIARSPSRTDIIDQYLAGQCLCVDRQSGRHANRSSGWLGGGGLARIIPIGPGPALRQTIWHNWFHLIAFRPYIWEFVCGALCEAQTANSSLSFN